MELLLQRSASVLKCTPGQLFLNDEFECFTLEDQVREVPGQPVKDWKIPGITAIPAGRYEIRLHDSPRFGRKLPWLQDVEGFSYILMHAGNKAGDTDGCILVGLGWNESRPDFLGDSRRAFNTLYPKIEAALAAGEKVFIEVRNAVPAANS